MDELTRIKDFPEELQKLFAEKPMLIFEARHFEYIEWFKTDLQQVCGFLQRTNDKTELQEYVKRNEEIFTRLDEDTYDLLTAMSGIRAMKLIKRDVVNVGGKYNMCKAFEDMMRDSKREGESNTRKLYEQLISAGRMDDLMHVSTDDGYFQKLMVEFGLK